jgi:protein-tyrosine phosphatase
MIVTEYTTTSYPDIDDRLDNAIEAIQICETDGEPIQVKGHDFLYVGSVGEFLTSVVVCNRVITNISYNDDSISGASRNKVSLQEKGITHIFNWSHSARCDLFDNIEYVCITDVSGNTGMRSHLADLDKYVDTLDSIIKSEGRVMVHCWYGKNRSVTHLIAYLMKYEEMTAVEANDLIKETRPQAKPYWDVLEEYSQHLERLKEEKGLTR